MPSFEADPIATGVAVAALVAFAILYAVRVRRG
jgi:hypothetical protein